MRTYELMMIHRPELAEPDVRSSVEQVETTINGAGTVTESDFWGKRRFAYEIDHVHEGYYSVVGFQAGNDLIESLDRSLRLSDDVLRHKIIRLDEDD